MLIDTALRAVAPVYRCGDLIGVATVISKGGTRVLAATCIDVEWGDSIGVDLFGGQVPLIAGPEPDAWVGADAAAFANDGVQPLDVAPTEPLAAATGMSYIAGMMIVDGQIKRRAYSVKLNQWTFCGMGMRSEEHEIVDAIARDPLPEGVRWLGSPLMVVHAADRVMGMPARFAIHGLAGKLFMEDKNGAFTSIQPFRVASW